MQEPEQRDKSGSQPITRCYLSDHKWPCAVLGMCFTVKTAVHSPAHWPGWLLLVEEHPWGTDLPLLSARDTGLPLDGERDPRTRGDTGGVEETREEVGTLYSEGSKSWRDFLYSLIVNSFFTLPSLHNDPISSPLVSSNQNKSSELN